MGVRSVLLTRRGAAAVLAGVVAGALMPALAHLRSPAGAATSTASASMGGRVPEDRMAFLAGARASRATAAASLPRWVRPTAGAVTGVFGEHRRRHRHPGIDFDGVTGDPVIVASDGRVTHAARAPRGYGGYGLLVVIDHGNGVESLYAHLSRIDVALGAPVVVGQSVGAIGTTGRSTGSHLHFEIRRDGVPVDPATFVPVR